MLRWLLTRQQLEKQLMITAMITVMVTIITEVSRRKVVALLLRCLPSKQLVKLKPMITLTSQPTSTCNLSRRLSS